VNADAPEQFHAVCPICRDRPGGPASLGVADDFASDPSGVRHGVLRCADPGCAAEFPVVDGLPIVRADARDFLAAAQGALRRRADLPDALERVLADTIDPGTREDLDRYYLSVYARDAYPGEGETSGIVALLDEVLTISGAPLVPGGAVLELGCGVGRACFELAARGQIRVVGIDANLPMLRCAAGVRDEGVARFGVRRAGVLYEPVERAHDSVGRERVELWCAEALDPPFAEGSFDTVLALNVLDCVASPVKLLQRASAMLRPGGRLMLTTPYDWTAGVTPMEAWLGGHSPRSDLAGDPASVLRDLLDPDAPGQTIDGLRQTAEKDRLPWSTRLHDRARLEYTVHAIVAEKTE
jgi:SAM-dependent methyltransferase